MILLLKILKKKIITKRDKRSIVTLRASPERSEGMDIDKKICINDNYELPFVDRKDIIDSITFDNDEEKDICECIISELESYAANTIKNMKVASLPFIGCLRINPIKHKFNTYKPNLSEERKKITKEEYKEKVKGVFNLFYKEQRKADKIKKDALKVKSNNKKLYDKLYKHYNKTIADLFIFGVHKLEYIPFDEEFEEQYKLLKDD